MEKQFKASGARTNSKPSGLSMVCLLVDSGPSCVGEPLAHQIILVGCVAGPNQVGELLIGDPCSSKKKHVGVMGEMDFIGTLALHAAWNLFLATSVGFQIPVHHPIICGIPPCPGDNSMVFIPAWCP